MKKEKYQWILEKYLKKCLGEYYEQLYANNFDHLEKWTSFQRYTRTASRKNRLNYQSIQYK